MRHQPLTFIPGLVADVVTCPICSCERQLVGLVGYRQHLCFAKLVRLVSIGEGTFFPLEQQLLKCPKCVTCYLYPLPTIDQLEQHYKESSKLHGTLDLSEYLRRLNAPEPTLTREPRDIIDVISTQYGIEGDELGTGFVADIGCNAADFLAGFRALGFTWLLGVEPDPILQERNAKFVGCDTHVGFANTVPESYVGKCSLVTLRDTLEHLLDPVNSLKQVWRLLKPGGVIYVKVPNFDCMLVQHNLHLYDWFEVDHLFYFSPSSVSNLLKSCGFERVHSQTVQSVYDNDDLSLIFNGRGGKVEALDRIGTTQTGRVLQAYGFKPLNAPIETGG